MSSRRTRDYAARLSRVAGKTGPEPEGGDAGQEPPGQELQESPSMPPPAVADQPPPRGRRRRRRSGPQIRVTVDLDRDTHRALRQLALDTDADATEIIRLLISRALRDPHSAEAIRAELDESG
jgi:hypothetical protein